MTFIFNLIPPLVLLSLLIFIHELGHFLACRFLGIRVEKFSIGFGPDLLKWKGKETAYAIAMIPLGGFVKPAGESSLELEGRAPQPGEFLAASPLERSVVVFAGVFMNYFSAYLLFALVFLIGRPVLGTTIGGFVEGYPAISSGLEAGDKIAAVNEKPVNAWSDVLLEIQKGEGESLILGVERRGEKLQFSLSPKSEEGENIFGDKRKISRLGIVPAQEFYTERYGVWGSLKEGGLMLFRFTALTVESVVRLVTGRLSLKYVSGPIGIFSITSKTASLGWVHLLQLAAYLSVSLAVFNLLPFPPLDGGALFFIVLEVLRRRQVSLRFQEWVTRAGYALLLMLMVVVMYNDLVNINFFGKIINLVHK